jgi:RNA polymerase sigma-70 factor (sigma-E family)
MPDDGTDRDAAFTEFVQTRQVALIRFAWLVAGGSRAQAEDLVQEALTRLYGRWSRVDDPEAYARTAISRLNISLWRKLRRERLHDAPVERAATDERLEALGADAALVRAVRTLPARQRLAVVLRYWCDYDDARIAETLGCTKATVRSTVRRALLRLRETWPQSTQHSMTGSPL